MKHHELRISFWATSPTASNLDFLSFCFSPFSAPWRCTVWSICRMTQEEKRKEKEGEDSNNTNDTEMNAADYDLSRSTSGIALTIAAGIFFIPFFYFCYSTNKNVNINFVCTAAHINIIRHTTTLTMYKTIPLKPITSHIQNTALSFFCVHFFFFVISATKENQI
jgi:hypothetical protein